MSQSIDQRVEQLRLRFRSRARDEHGLLAAALAAGDLGELRRLAHSLSGAGGIFGYPGISALAAALEGALDRAEPPAPSAAALLAELEKLG